jgi:hypothetical protein
MMYLLDNFDVDYADSYNPQRILTAFIPLDGSDATALPTKCFSDARVAIMGFPVMQQAYRKFSSKLGVAEVPSATEMIQQLRAQPVNLSNASEVFAFLGSHQAKFSTRDWSILRTLEFIPVASNSKTVYYSPNRVYMRTEGAIFDNVFVYVSFGGAADLFLRACGVQEQPSPVELASSIVQDPDAYLSNGFEEYLNLLRLIAANFRAIKTNSRLLSEMKKSAFLIGIRPVEADGATNQQYCLGRASSIYLIDDTVLAQLFQPLGAPVEELLEGMYEALGSTWLSRNVRVSYSPKGTPARTNETDLLQRDIQERAPLILYDGQQTRAASDLLPNALEMLARLQVRSVPQIGIVRRFENISKSQETSCCLATFEGNVNLLVTKSFDYFDVASMIAKLILKQPRLNDSLLISTLLSTSLQNLTRKGFPVDRILNLKKNKVPVPAVPTPLPEMNPEKEVRHQQSVDSSVSRDESSAPPSRRESIASSKSSSSKRDPIQKDLYDMFKSLSSTLGLSDDKSGIKKEPLKKEPSLPGSWQSSTTQSTQKELVPPPTKPNISPRDKETLSAQLQDSVSSVRSSREKSINTTFPEKNVTTPTISTYCSPLTEQDLVLVLVVNDTPIYVDKSVADEGLAMILANEDAVERFTLVLQFLSSVFGLPQNSTQVYWDSNGSTVAFNRNRTLFFNFRFYLGWHFVRNHESEHAKTYHYWFMTFCHELAHNFHGPHDATHEYWMSSFAENYMGKLMDAMNTYGIKN